METNLRNSDILLVNPPGNSVENEHLEPPLGLLSIASFVAAHSQFRPSILDLTKYDIEAATDILLQHEARVYGFTVYCTKWHITKKMINALRNKYGTKPIIVVGGPNPTAMPHKTKEFTEIDIVVVGEGEKAFLKILFRIFNLKRATLPKMIVNGERLKTHEFPVLDRSLIAKPEDYGRRAGCNPVVTLEASRGCLNKCIFCNSVVMGGGSGGIIRKDISKVVSEITEMKKSGYRDFRFNDDSFTYSAYNSGLLDELEHLNIRFRAFVNANHLTENVISKLIKSGCQHISVGIESYNPDNLKIIGKFTSPKQIRDGINAASRQGIIVRAYFIVGLPFDNMNNIKMYMERVAKEVDFSEYAVYPLIPYPGTEIWKSPSKFGYRIVNDDIDQYVQIGKKGKSVFVISHENFNPEDIMRWHKLTTEIFDGIGKIKMLDSKFV